MTLQDFLTLTLPERIIWLHSTKGPHGKLSHDRFAERLGTTRQTVINWEKKAGIEPNSRYRKKLAEFSGFPEGTFSRREAEVLTEETFGHLLLRLRDEADRNRLIVESIVLGLQQADIAIPDPPAPPQSAATEPPASQPPGSP